MLSTPPYIFLPFDATNVSVNDPLRGNEICDKIITPDLEQNCNLVRTLKVKEEKTLSEM